MRRLGQIYRTRAEKVLYLSAQDEVHFQRVMDIVDIVERPQYLDESPEQRPPLPAELRKAEQKKEYTNIRIEPVTPAAVNSPCPESCFNWGKHGLPMMPQPSQ